MRRGYTTRLTVNDVLVRLKTGRNLRLRCRQTARRLQKSMATARVALDALIKRSALRRAQPPILQLAT